MNLHELDAWLADRRLVLFLRAGGGMYWAQLKRPSDGTSWETHGRSSSEAVLCVQSFHDRECAWTTGTAGT